MTTCFGLFTLVRPSSGQQGNLKRSLQSYRVIGRGSIINLLFLTCIYSETCLKRNAIVPIFFFSFSQVSVLQRVVF